MLKNDLVLELAWNAIRYVFERACEVELALKINTLKEAQKIDFYGENYKVFDIYGIDYKMRAQLIIDELKKEYSDLKPIFKAALKKYPEINTGGYTVKLSLKKFYKDAERFGLKL